MIYKTLMLVLAVATLNSGEFTAQTSLRKAKKEAEVKITLVAQPGWKFNDKYPLFIRGYLNEVGEKHRLRGAVTYSTLPGNSWTEFIFRIPLEKINLTKDKIFVKINFSFCNTTTCRVWRGEMFEFTKKDLE